MAWHSPLPCLKVVRVTASSFTGANKAANTIDSDLRTRWAGAAGGEQWLTYDLGTQREVSGVSLVWHTRCLAPVRFTVAVSPDGRTYHETDKGMLTGIGSSVTLRTFIPQTGQYVRLTFENDGSSILPTIIEVGVHGIP